MIDYTTKKIISLCPIAMIFFENLGKKKEQFARTWGYDKKYRKTKNLINYKNNNVTSEIKDAARDKVIYIGNEILLPII